MRRNFVLSMLVIASLCFFLPETPGHAKALDQDLPIMPIYFGVNQRLWKPYVHGVTADPMGLVMLRFVSADRGRK